MEEKPAREWEDIEEKGDIGGKKGQWEKEKWNEERKLCCEWDINLFVDDNNIMEWNNFTFIIIIWKIVK